jgi:DNA-binding IclR family transcriptional regulator
MPKQKALPPLTPRAKQVVNFVVNAVAFGTHDNDGEVGAIAEQLETTEGRLQPILRKLQDQGYLELKGNFVYPTVAALRRQNPALTERQAANILRRLR